MFHQNNKVDPLVLVKRNETQNAITELNKEFPDLKLFENKFDFLMPSPKSTPNSARSNASSDINESHSSLSPERAGIPRLGSAPSPSTSRSTAPTGSNLVRSNSSEAKHSIFTPAREITVSFRNASPAFTRNDIEQGDLSAIQRFIDSGGDFHEVYIFNRPIMHFLLINAAQSQPELPKAWSFFCELLSYIDLSFPDKNGRTILDILDENRVSKLKILLQAKESLALTHAEKITAFSFAIEGCLVQFKAKIKSIGCRGTKLEKNTPRSIKDFSTVAKMIEAIACSVEKIIPKELSQYLPGILTTFEPDKILEEILNAGETFDTAQKIISILIVAKMLVADVQQNLLIMTSFSLNLTRFIKENVTSIPEHGPELAAELTKIVNLKKCFQQNVGIKNYLYLCDNITLEATAALTPIKEIIAKAAASEIERAHAARILAQELNAIYYSIYKCIRFSEFRDGVWGKKNKGLKAPHLNELQQISEQLTRFVSQLIFTAEVEHISNYIMLIILTAKSLLQTSSHFSANLFMATTLISTLDISQISRLEPFFDLMPEAYNKILADLKKFATDKSYKWVRLFQQAEPNTPVHIAIMQRDLTVGSDANQGLALLSIRSKPTRDFITRQKRNMGSVYQFSTDLGYQLMQVPLVDYEPESKKLVATVVELTGTCKEIIAIINRELEQHFYPRFRIAQEDGTFAIPKIYDLEEEIGKLLVKKLNDEDVTEADFDAAKSILRHLKEKMPKKPNSNSFFAFTTRLATINASKQVWQNAHTLPPAASPVTPGKP